MNRLHIFAALATVSAAAIAYSASHVALAKTNDNAKLAVNTDSGTMERADLDMKAVLESLQKLGGKPIEKLTPEEARKQPTPTDAVVALLKEQGKDVEELKAALKVSTQDITYNGADGAQKARVYIPDDIEDDQKPLPVIVYYHGGGFVIADIDVYDAAPRALAREAQAIVISAEYRHAPEHKFPAAHDDAFAAYEWTLKNAGQYGGDPKRVAVAGESAGGNLAANVAIKARDKKIQAPLHMLLVYPLAGNDMTTESYVENEKAKPLNKAMMAWFVKHTVASETDTKDTRINLVAADLKDLPSATIITAEIDPLRSEGELLADKLEDAGNKVYYTEYEGVTHEFFGMGFAVKDAVTAQKSAAKNLRKAFEK